MTPLHPTRAVLALSLVLAACSDSTGPGGGPSIQIVRGSSVTDTIGAVLSQALVVEVHDSTGAAAPEGTLVRFESVNEPAQVYVQVPSGSYNGTAVTDAAGHVSAIVTLGARPGVGHVAVTVPSLGMVEYATYTTTVGNAAHTRITPPDTLLYIGNSVTLHGAVVDRFENPRSDAITWSGPTSGLSVSNAGVVTASALGRYWVKATGNGATDSTSVTVVPRGRLAGTLGKFSSFSVAVFDADGSNYSTPVTSATVSNARNPKWIPGSTSLVYEHTVVGTQGLFLLTADGQSTPFFSVPATMRAEYEPAPTADGKWVYFIAEDSGCGTFVSSCVARVATDGSGLELVNTSQSRTPSPSPDGSKVAYASSVGSAGTVRVFDVATHTASTWSVAGSSPAWSPDGSQIAYVTLNNTVAIITPDGAPVRTLPAPAAAAVLYGWSPDGKWLLSGGALIDAVTGATIPLQYRNQVFVTSMK